MKKLLWRCFDDRNQDTAHEGTYQECEKYLNHLRKALPWSQNVHFHLGYHIIEVKE